MTPTFSPAARITRRLPGTPEQIFDAWTDPRQFRVWMAPGGMVVSHATADLKVGGAYELVMRGDSGEIPHHGVYREIDRPRRLVFTWQSPFTGPEPSVVTIELKPTFGGTDLTLTHEKLPADQVEAHQRGWNSVGEKLEAWLGAGATA